jgi:hypothetical protein
MRKEPVISEADAESAGHEHREKERDLKPVESEMPEVDWNAGERDCECADEERTGRPIDAMKWETRHS